ncbi:MAG: tripartite tricarboxylate transporter TctB family protein [Pseudomonadota bacterium]
MKSDRLFGVVIILCALAYAAGALQIQTSFMSDPVGSKTFPLILAAIATLCGVVMVFQPDTDPDWPSLKTFGVLSISVLVMVGYAYTIKPLGFMIPTAVCAAILSFQISPRTIPAAITGVALSIGLFFVFKYALGLGLQPFPKGWL